MTNLKKILIDIAFKLWYAFYCLVKKYGLLSYKNVQIEEVLRSLTKSSYEYRFIQFIRTFSEGSLSC